MTPTNPPGSDPTDHDEPHRLVCGRCGAVVDGVLPDQARADEAADDHARDAHPEHPSVVILAIRDSQLEERREDAIAIATAAQRRIDARNRENGGTR